MENNFIDAVLTSESDAILFGARHVLRWQMISLILGGN